MLTKDEITANWLPRYTGMPLEKFGEYILVTNFGNYVRRFAEIFGSNYVTAGFSAVERNAIDNMAKSAKSPTKF